ncbi:MAG: zinc-dependent alcohol dehydrogenase [Anaerolineae bacterium]
MKAVQFVDSIPSYVLSKSVGSFYPPIFYGPLSCLRYRDVPEPRLPGPDWVKIKVKYGGICGSDINLIRLHDSPSTSPFASFPFTMGHENVGTIVEVGENVKDFAPGDRVVADPLLPCPTRGFSGEEMCPQCQRGEYPRCENFARGNISPGLMIGACRDTGGSWSECFVAHRFQLFRVPEAVSDEQAIVVDAFCSALHPVMRNFPRDEDNVLVIGAGIIGLCVVAALRALGSRARVITLARYPFQGELAERYGADEVIYAGRGMDYYRAVAETFRARLYKPILGKRVMTGGADVVFECVGSDDSIDDALRFTRAGGRLVLVGLVGISKEVDWTPVWFKELTVAGTNSSSAERYEGQPVRDYALALQWLAEGKLDFSPLLTHTFPLSEYKRAIEVNMHKSRYKAIKTAFLFLH